MKHCLDQSQLEQLLADVLPSREQAVCDAHLSDCPACRDRLEQMTDVAGLSRVMRASSTLPASESRHLKQVINRLQSELTCYRSTPSTLSSGATTHTAIPRLQPTTKPGFIGRLGDILIKRVLGQGGMGVVFEGLDSVLNRTVAVKVLSPHMLNHPDAKERFVREAQAAATLLHENVVAIHGIHQAEGMPYLVLQYVQGESLSDKLQREKRLPLDQVVRLGRQVARGLAAAHDRGLVHRDIKPGNILFDAETGDVRIADFGLAKHVGTETLTAKGVLTGTPAYMSPEQASGKAIDARSDLFSLGVVLYQASSGKLPFTADSPFVLLDHIRSTPERPLKELISELPDWFCELVHRLLQKEPENRIATAQEVERILTEQSGITPLAGAAAKNRNWVPVLLVSLLVMGGLGVVWLMKVSTNSSVQPSPRIMQEGFSINGKPVLLPTLAEAIEVASDSGVIEVHGDGPFSCNTITIENKKLTIRSAVGSHPRIIPEVTGTTGYRQFITSNQDLHLEGLEIYWPLIPPGLKTDEPLTRSVVTCYHGKLTAINCRIVGGPGTACLASDGQELVVERCHLVSPNGVCLGWRMGPHPVRMENCILEGRFAFSVARPVGIAEELRNPVILSNNTIRGHRFIHYLIDSRTRNYLDFQMLRNVIDCNYLVTLISVARPLTLLNTHDAILEAMQNSMTWKETGNFYRRKTIYLASTRLASIGTVLSSEFKQLSQWLTHWKLENTQSQEGTIVFQEAASASGKIGISQLLRGDGGSEVPQGIGVVEKHIGPGAAYANWRKENTARQ